MTQCDYMKKKNVEKNKSKEIANPTKTIHDNHHNQQFSQNNYSTNQSTNQPVNQSTK